MKITPSIAWSTSMLAWGMLTFGEGYNKSNTWKTGMDTLKWNTDYLLKTIKVDPAGSATSEATEFYIVYQVCCEMVKILMSTLLVQHLAW